MKFNYLVLLLVVLLIAGCSTTATESVTKENSKHQTTPTTIAKQENKPSVTTAPAKIWTELSRSNYNGSSSYAVIDGKIYATSVANRNNVQLEEYDPSSDKWTIKSSPSIKRYIYSTVTVNNKIYLIGGATTSDSQLTNAVEEYDPATDTWIQKKPMSTPRCGNFAVVIGEKVYCIGQGIIEEYDTKKDTWKTVCSKLMNRCGTGLAVCESKLYIIGGATTDWKKALSDVEEYDPSTKKLVKKSKLASPVNYPYLVTYEDTIYLVWGTDAQGYIGTSTVQAYDPDTDTWKLKNAFPNPRADIQVTMLNGKIYTIGGWLNNNFVDSVEEYDPAKDVWTIKTPMPGIRNYHCVTAIGDKIYVFGGKITYETGLKSTLAYDPAIDID